MEINTCNCPLTCMSSDLISNQLCFSTNSPAVYGSQSPSDSSKFPVTELYQSVNSLTASPTNVTMPLQLTFELSDNHTVPSLFLPPSADMVRNVQNDCDISNSRRMSYKDANNTSSEVYCSSNHMYPDDPSLFCLSLSGQDNNDNTENQSNVVSCPILSEDDKNDPVVYLMNNETKIDGEFSEDPNKNNNEFQQWDFFNSSLCNICMPVCSYDMYNNVEKDNSQNKQCNSDIVVSLISPPSDPSTDLDLTVYEKENKNNKGPFFNEDLIHSPFQSFSFPKSPSTPLIESSFDNGDLSDGIPNFQEISFEETFVDINNISNMCSSSPHIQETNDISISLPLADPLYDDLCNTLPCSIQIPELSIDFIPQDIIDMNSCNSSNNLFIPESIYTNNIHDNNQMTHEHDSSVSSSTCLYSSNTRVLPLSKNIVKHSIADLLNPDILLEQHKINISNQNILPTDSTNSQSLSQVSVPIIDIKSLDNNKNSSYSVQRYDQNSSNFTLAPVDVTPYSYGYINSNNDINLNTVSNENHNNINLYNNNSVNNYNNNSFPPPSLLPMFPTLPRSHTRSRRKEDRECAICHTRETPKWRRSPPPERLVLCNACGLQLTKECLKGRFKMSPLEECQGELCRRDRALGKGIKRRLFNRNILYLYILPLFS
ncbi:hypothetical protein WA158_006611 [Blastocystis sp. Blastoise]